MADVANRVDVAVAENGTGLVDLNEPSLVQGQAPAARSRRAAGRAGVLSGWGHRLRPDRLAKAHRAFAAICNPVAQARLLNQRQVVLVAQMGLCIGHDLLLQKECEAPGTTIVVKDRVFDHQTVRALRPERAPG